MSCRNCFAVCFSPLRSLVKIRIITLLAVVEFIIYQVLGFYAVSLYNLISLFIGLFIYGLAIATVFYYKSKLFLLVFSLYKAITIAVTTAYLVIWIDVIMVQCKLIENNPHRDNIQGSQFIQLTSVHEINQVMNCLPVYHSAAKVLVIVGLFLTICFDVFFALMSFRYYRHLRESPSFHDEIVSPIAVQSTVCRQESTEPMFHGQEVHASPVGDAISTIYRPNEMIVGRTKNDFPA